MTLKLMPDERIAFDRLERDPPRINPVVFSRLYGSGGKNVYLLLQLVGELYRNTRNLRCGNGLFEKATQLRDILGLCRRHPDYGNAKML